MEVPGIDGSQVRFLADARGGKGDKIRIEVVPPPLTRTEFTTLDIDQFKQVVDFLVARLLDKAEIVFRDGRTTVLKFSNDYKLGYRPSNSRPGEMVLELTAPNGKDIGAQYLSKDAVWITSVNAAIRRRVAQITAGAGSAEAAA